MDVNNEATKILDESAIQAVPNHASASQGASADKKKDTTKWKQASVAAAAGVAMGAAAPVMMGMANSDIELADVGCEEGDSKSEDESQVKDVNGEAAESHHEPAMPSMTLESPTLGGSHGPVVGHIVEEPQIVEVNDSEIEILGIEQTDTGEILGSLSVDGQEAVVIDVNGDMHFDSVGIDFNGDGILDNDEIIEISGHEISIDDLGDYSESINIEYNDPVDYSDSSDGYDPGSTDEIQSDMLYNQPDHMMLGDLGMDDETFDVNDDISADFYGA
ncbi:MAG: hypothetical protein HDS11_06020 [Bacteroides sp.]|nr:hypothetical protein [Bacteroides sp.]